MDPTENAPQVETAPAPQDQPTAQPDSQAGVTTGTTVPTSAQLADAEREFNDFYAAQYGDQPAPAADDQPTGEAAPVAEQPPVEPPPGGEEPGTEEPAGDINAPGKVRVRLSHDDDVAIAGIQRALKLPSFGEAAKVFYGMQQQAAAAAPAPNGEQPSAPASQASPVQELETQVAALADEIAAERTEGNYLTGDHLDKVSRLAELRGDLKLAQFQESQRAQAQQQTQAQEAGRAVDASYAAARAEFPTVGDPASPIRQAADIVAAEWAANPATVGRLNRTDTPQMLAREAAERVAANLVGTGRFRTIDQALASLKAPAAPGAPAAPAAVVAPKVVTPPAPQPRRVAPAPGSRGQQNPGQHQTLGSAIAAAKTAEEADRIFDEAAESGEMTMALRRR